MRNARKSIIKVAGIALLAISAAALKQTYRPAGCAGSCPCAIGCGCTRVGCAAPAE